MIGSRVGNMLFIIVTVQFGGRAKYSYRKTSFLYFSVILVVSILIALSGVFSLGRLYCRSFFVSKVSPSCMVYLSSSNSVFSSSSRMEFLSYTFQSLVCLLRIFLLFRPQDRFLVEFVNPRLPNSEAVIAVVAVERLFASEVVSLFDLFLSVTMQWLPPSKYISPPQSYVLTPS